MSQQERWLALPARKPGEPKPLLGEGRLIATRPNLIGTWMMQYRRGWVQHLAVIEPGYRYYTAACDPNQRLNHRRPLDLMRATSCEECLLEVSQPGGLFYVEP